MERRRLITPTTGSTTVGARAGIAMERRLNSETGRLMTHLSMLTRTLLAAGLLAPMVGCTARDDTAASSDSDLIGGYLAGMQPPGLVGLTRLCGAAKVGPRHFLTAGHCVIHRSSEVDQETLEVSGIYARGEPTCLYPDPTIDAIAPCAHTVRIERTVVHPSYARHVKGSAPGVVSSAISDVALMVVQEETPQIPTVDMDFAPMAPGDEVLMTGYGCTVLPTPGAPQSDERRLRLGLAAVASVQGNVFLTGPNSPVAGCPGDSGSPVYRQSADKSFRVVGVNSFVIPADLRTAMARIDEAETGAGGWIKEQLAAP